MDIWEMIATERRSTADMLEALSADQWQQPSLCDQWSVKVCAAHLTAGWNLSWAKFGFAIARHRGNFNRANATLATQLAERTPNEIVADLRANAEHRFTPPGLGPEAPLTDVLIHTRDITTPLGIEHAVVPEHAIVPLDRMVLAKAKAFQPPGGIAGLRYQADDHPWNFGTGPAVTGSAVDLLCALGNRQEALKSLAGDGLAAFGARFA